MNDGVIQQIGTPQEVFNHPANMFVAGFIGTPQMNFFPAKLSVSSGKYTVRICDAEYLLPDDKQKILSLKKQSPCEVIIGIRPEHISVLTNNTDNSIKARLDVPELMGSEVYLHTVVNDEKSM